MDRSRSSGGVGWSDGDHVIVISDRTFDLAGLERRRTPLNMISRPCVSFFLFLKQISVWPNDLLWSACNKPCNKFVTEICYILVTAVFIDPEVRNYKNKIVSPKSMLCLHNGLFRFGSDYFETECHCNLCNKFCNKFVTSVSKFVTSVFIDPEVKNFKNKIVSPKSILCLQNVPIILGSECFWNPSHFDSGRLC